MSGATPEACPDRSDCREACPEAEWSGELGGGEAQIATSLCLGRGCLVGWVGRLTIGLLL